MTVEQARDGELRVLFAGQRIWFVEIEQPWPREKAAHVVEPVPRRATGRKPAADHPWKRYPAVEQPAPGRGGLWK